jgi:hypothetical protein
MKGMVYAILGVCAVVFIVGVLFAPIVSELIVGLLGLQ